MSGGVLPDLTRENALSAALNVALVLVLGGACYSWGWFDRVEAADVAATTGVAQTPGIGELAIYLGLVMLVIIGAVKLATGGDQIREALES
jgi:hypothetical protein